MGAGYNMRAKADQSAEIFIYEDVGESFFGGVSAKQFASDLKGLGSVTRIDLRLNSYGGEVFDGMAIYRQLVEHPARVVSHIDGVAASIASVIAMAGDEIVIAEAGFLMIHNASGLVMGEAKDMRQMADTLETISATIADVYVGRTKNQAPAIREWMDAETWFAGAEAVSNGFADSVVENLRIAAHGDISRHRFQHAPAALAARPTSPAAEAAAPGARPARDAAALHVSRMRARLQRAAAEPIRAA
jgi:ATP-dependent Clp protease protease subunit